MSSDKSENLRTKSEKPESEADSQTGGIGAEWKLLLQGFLGDQGDTAKDLDVPMSMKELTSLKKSLSQKRKTANQQIERIKNEIEQYTAVIENLKLVGSDTEETEAMIEELKTEGSAVSEVLSRIDQQLQRVRELE